MDKPLQGWKPERKRKQAEVIRKWQPWARSIGTKSLEGKAVVALNTWKGRQLEQLREIVKMVNTEMVEARELLAKSSICVDNRRV